MWAVLIFFLFLAYTYLLRFDSRVWIRLKLFVPSPSVTYEYHPFSL